jgi:hypothetical protein
MLFSVACSVRLSSKEDRVLFMSILNDCYKYVVAINAKGQPFPSELLILALLLIPQHKMIDWLTKQFSKQESLDNNSKEVKRSEEEEQNLGKVQLSGLERMKEFIILMLTINVTLDKTITIDELPAG